jgi:hypothetical protein
MLHILWTTGHRRLAPVAGCFWGERFHLERRWLDLVNDRTEVTEVFDQRSVTRLGTLTSL